MRGVVTRTTGVTGRQHSVVMPRAVPSSAVVRDLAKAPPDLGNRWWRWRVERRVWKTTIVERRRGVGM